MDDWLLRGGSLGTVLGFAIGARCYFPIGWVLRKLDGDARPPLAKSPTPRRFSRPVSFATGWMMPRLLHRLSVGGGSRRPYLPNFSRARSMELIDRQPSHISSHLALPPSYRAPHRP